VSGKLITAAKYLQIQKLCSLSGFRREADENFALLGYYAESSGNFLPTFRDVLVPSSYFDVVVGLVWSHGPKRYAGE
jgi:hypothetical protein